MTRTYTFDLSDDSADFFIRGYFVGSQHFIRVWDQNTEEYLFPFFCTNDEAQSYVESIGAVDARKHREAQWGPTIAEIMAARVIRDCAVTGSSGRQIFNPIRCDIEAMIRCANDFPNAGDEHRPLLIQFIEELRQHIADVCAAWVKVKPMDYVSACRDYAIVCSLRRQSKAIQDRVNMFLSADAL